MDANLLKRGALAGINIYDDYFNLVRALWEFFFALTGLEPFSLLHLLPVAATTTPNAIGPHEKNAASCEDRRALDF